VVQTLCKVPVEPGGEDGARSAFMVVIHAMKLQSSAFEITGHER
jgi:hypothetical protein